MDGNQGSRAPTLRNLLVKLSERKRKGHQKPLGTRTGRKQNERGNILLSLQLKLNEKPGNRPHPLNTERAPAQITREEVHKRKWEGRGFGRIHASGPESRCFLVENALNLWVNLAEERHYIRRALLPCPVPTKLEKPCTLGFLSVSHEGVSGDDHSFTHPFRPQPVSVGTWPPTRRDAMMSLFLRSLWSR